MRFRRFVTADPDITKHKLEGNEDFLVLFFLFLFLFLFFIVVIGFSLK